MSSMKLVKYRLMMSKDLSGAETAFTNKHKIKDGLQILDMVSSNKHLKEMLLHFPCFVPFQSH